MKGVAMGRMVRFVLSKGKNRGQERAAAICYVVDKEKGVVNLTIFSNGPHDGPDYPGIAFEENVKYSEKNEEGSWHWPERA